MVLMKKYIDLALIDNQILVAQDWVIYRERIIISADLRYQIEAFVDTYTDGMITKIELYNLTLDAIHIEFKSSRN
jgi:hypothetical protein